MNPQRLRKLLERLRNGDLTVDDGLAELRSLPFKDVGIAVVDHHRAMRQGCPEVVYGAGKTSEQLLTIAQELARHGQNVLITRLDAAKATALSETLAEFRYDETARTGHLEQLAPEPRECEPVALICAGTSDIPVAAEAAATLRAVGLASTEIFDVGVAGIHRLLHRIDELERASAAIVIAGMEGALPSVVGGIVSCPIVAVPTSTGYGTALAGFTALMAMLTSCASGVTVVNIDNGFGAAMAVHRMLPKAR